MKVKHLYSRLRQGSPFMEQYNIKNYPINPTSTASSIPSNVMLSSSNHINVIDNLAVKKSPLTSSMGSRVSSLNNSSGELNESKTVSIDFEKTNSLSSDEGSFGVQGKKGLGAAKKQKNQSGNSLTVQTFCNHLGQSMPNLYTTPGPYQVNSNTLLVPGASGSRSSNSSNSGKSWGISPSQRGISYPPPSPTR